MEKVQKIGFFKRVKMSVLDLEKYNVFLNEKVSVALKYLFKLLLILVAIFSISTTIQFTNQVDALLNYVQAEFPNFEYKEGALTVDKFVDAYDKTYDAKLIVDTGDVAEEKLETYSEMAEENSVSAILLKDKALVRANGVAAEIPYADLLDSAGVTTLNKDTIVNKYNQTGFLFQLGIGIYIYSFMVLYVQYFLVVLENILVVMIFGWIASRIVGAKLPLSKAFSISIYSLTLSSILNVIYSVVSNFTGFEIKYFGLMYLIIGYIYMMASILIHKADIIEGMNKQEEVKNEDKADSQEKELEDVSDKKENNEDIKSEKKKGRKSKKDNNDNKDIKNEDNKD